MDVRIAQARKCFDDGRWGEALERFSDLADQGLDLDDHERRAICAYLVGADETSTTAWEAAYDIAHAADDAVGAARCAFWAALGLMVRGQMARAGGWFARVERAVENAPKSSGAAGYLAVPGFLGALESGDHQTALELARRGVMLGKVASDRDLEALGLLGEGQALLALGEVDRGAARFDEVMVAVASGAVGPIATGLIYCAVVAGCMEVFDVSRAAEWTGALDDWCESQPDLVPYRGQCLVHRSQIQHMSGEWSSALESIRSACDRLTDPPHPALGLARYQHAELLRVTGAVEEAEQEYREASRLGFEPMPGLALLHLRRGDVGIASASIDRLLQESKASPGRPLYLAAAVEICLAGERLDEARAAAAELVTWATASASEMLAAMASQAVGAVLVRDGELADGLRELRLAAGHWRGLRMPYERARTALLIGEACEALGDPTTASLEFENARTILTELGAGGNRRSDRDRSGPPKTKLTSRELEVLALVAAGRTNREVADELVISAHTVRRHLENVYTKLGVGGRAAATAYVLKHDLL